MIADSVSPVPIAASASAIDAKAKTAPASVDSIFHQEQQHLSETYATLQSLAVHLVRKMEKTQRDAADTKQSMADDLSLNFAADDDAMETYAAIASMNRVIDGYNIAQSTDAEKLSNVQTLLRQPYFAKVVLQFKADEEPKELYIGNAGVSDEDCRRMVVDWRSPVAETYYNQDNGRTSYVADGRTITADLQLRRQFDIEGNQLRDYFDTTVAIQDALLLASLSRGRTAQLQAITATIQKEQNLVVRHEDVPVLLVSGIAGSGKTSVLLQRIAYLFYQNREKLDPREVFLLSPNPLFERYIENVLPDLGERNPVTLTFDEFARTLLPAGRGTGGSNVTLESLERIDRAARSFEFEDDDFRDLCCDGTRLIAAAQIRKMASKFHRIPAGPHRATLIREELHKRLTARLKQMASTERAQNEMYALSIEEQLRIFHETVDPQNEREEQALTLRYLNDRYAEAFTMVEHDDWLHIDRIGMRLLGVASLAPLEWLYLKMSVTGLSNPDAKYVMIDEVQDYTAAQLAILARYFRRAHFLLLGDPNQAIASGTASWDEIRTIFARSPKQVEECQLMTSYRSSPEITSLFAPLAGEKERMHISSVQREGVPPVVRTCVDEGACAADLRRSVQQAREAGGLTAIIVPWKQEAKRVQKLLAQDCHENAPANAAGVAAITSTAGMKAASPADARTEITSLVNSSTTVASANVRVSVDNGAVAGGSKNNPGNGANGRTLCDNIPLISENDALPTEGVILITLRLAKGLEFDRVIIPNASERVFPNDDLSRRRLYTTISRATHEVVIFSQGALTPLLSMNTAPLMSAK